MTFTSDGFIVTGPIPLDELPDRLRKLKAECDFDEADVRFVFVMNAAENVIVEWEDPPIEYEQ